MGGGNADRRIEDVLQKAKRANVLSGRLDDDGKNSRRGRKPLSAGEAGIGSPNEGLRGLALSGCMSSPCAAELQKIGAKVYVMREINLERVKLRVIRI